MAYTHKTVTLRNHIPSDTVKKNEITIRNPSPNKLLSIICKRFPFLSNTDDSEWYICINSQIMDKYNPQKIASILSTTPPTAVIEIRNTAESIDCIEEEYSIIVHYNGKQYIHKLNDNKDEWDEDTYHNLRTVITQKFQIYSDFALYEDVDGDKVDIDDMDDIIAGFDDDQNDEKNESYDCINSKSLHIFVTVLHSNDEKLEEKHMNFIEDDGEHPVRPLIIPNNCSYNEQTGKLTKNDNIPRTGLKIVPKSLQYIASIGSKVTTISIVGRARTGKSLVAGQLYAPDKIPCPFDLGHKMDACTYGVWVSGTTIEHPNEEGSVVLIFDVEGTGFHKADKRHDMQLMVITLLISSYFIYNSKGSFDAPALDEIKFIIDLTEKINSTSNGNNNGKDFRKFFPKFMWLLRDVHLVPVIDNKRVSVRDYFTEKVLSSEDGFSRAVQERENIRRAFIQMFKDYDAFTLPMPHAKQSVLQQLGNIPRSCLEPEFNKQLKEFCNKVMEEAQSKVLFSKNGNEDQYYHCTGSHLAKCIEKYVEAVNTDKIPQISSMTEAVMANYYRETKTKAVKEYTELLQNGLDSLRNGNDKLPLNENEIISLHLTVFDGVLNSTGNSLQPPQNGNDIHDFDEKSHSEINQQQFKIYCELCTEIGHYNKVELIGQTGIMQQILSINSVLSVSFCQDFLNKYCNENIEPMLQVESAQQHDPQDMSDKFEELEELYFAQCKGPAKSKCWHQFQSNRMTQSLQNFKQFKGFSDQLLERQKEASELRAQHRTLTVQHQKQGQDLAAQRQLMSQEIARMENVAKDAEIKHENALKQQQTTLQNMHNTRFNELTKAHKQSTDAMTKQIQSLQQTSAANIAKVTKTMNDTVASLNKKHEQQMEELRKRQIAVPNFNYSGMIRYCLRMSSMYYANKYNFNDLITDDGNMGAGTTSQSNAYIEAYFGGVVCVSYIEVKGCAPNMAGGWHSGGCNAYPCVLQYKNTYNQWIQLRDFRTSKIPSNYVTRVHIGQNTEAVRVYNSSGYASCGTLRVFGGGGHGGYVHMHAYNGMIPYTLNMSSHYGGPPDSYSHLISDDENMGAGTTCSSNQYIEANLGGNRYVSRIEVKGCGERMSGGWGCSAKTNRYSCVVQYRNTSNQWITLRDFRSSKMPSNYVTNIAVGQYTGAVRVYNSSGYASCGTLRVFG